MNRWNKKLNYSDSLLSLCQWLILPLFYELLTKYTREYLHLHFVLGNQEVCYIFCQNENRVIARMLDVCILRPISWSDMRPGPRESKISFLAKISQPWKSWNCLWLLKAFKMYKNLSTDQGAVNPQITRISLTRILLTWGFIKIPK